MTIKYNFDIFRATNFRPSFFASHQNVFMKKELYLLIGQRIKNARISKGLNQEGLANKLKPKKTAASISNIEKGGQKIYVEFLYEVAEALGVEIEIFLPTIQQYKDSIPTIEKELKKHPKREQKIVEEIRERAIKGTED